jgi:hypothetical protein
MKSVIVLSLIVVFMLFAYFLNKWLRGIIHPKRSFGRLILYFILALLAIFTLSFLMVFIITKLYPGELIK